MRRNGKKCGDFSAAAWEQYQVKRKELLNLFVDIDFVDFLCIAFVLERALAHTEDDLRAAVIQNEQVLCDRVNAHTFDFAGTTLPLASVLTDHGVSLTGSVPLTRPV